jgi:alpha-tubulin suppressor-like RCC1 family protein
MLAAAFLRVLWAQRAHRVASLIGGLIVCGALGAVAPATAAAEGSCKQNGTAVVAWGANGHETLGLGYKSGKENAPRTVLGLTGVHELQVGYEVEFAVLTNCKVVSWGSTEKGKLGDGIPHLSQPHPVPVVNIENVKEINGVKGPSSHPMALEFNGTVWTWGFSEFGERGNGERDFEAQAKSNPEEKELAKPRYEPAEVPDPNNPASPLTNVKQVAAGGIRDYALLNSGEVLAWGGDEGNELGVEAPEKECNGEPSPGVAKPCVTRPHNVKVSGSSENLTGVEKIAAGPGTAYAVRNGGTELLAWGSNAGGQIGNRNASDPTTRAVKVEWTPPSPIVEVSPGTGDVFARLQNGQIYAWGTDAHGQLGFPASETTEQCNNKAACSRVPLLVGSLTHVVQVSASEAYTLVLKEEPNGERAIYAFGFNGFWELLGLGRAKEGTSTETSTPTKIEGLSSVASVDAGQAVAAALLESGSGPPPILTANPLSSSVEVSGRRSRKCTSSAGIR